MSRDVTINQAENWLLGTIRFSARKQQLQRSNTTVNLEPRQHKLLLTLMANATQPVTRETLISEVWDGRIVSDGAINRAISMLRKALAQLDPHTEFIVTRPKLGYQLNIIAQPENTAVTHESAELAYNNNSRSILQYASLIGVLVICLFWWWRTGPANLQLGVMQPQSSFDGLESQVSSNVRNQFLLYRRVSAEGNGQVWLNDLVDNSHRPLTNATENSQYPQLSPDGQTLAYVRLSNQACDIMLLQLNQPPSTARSIHQCPIDNIPKLSWQANSSAIYFRQRVDKTQPYQIYKLNINNNTLQQLTLLAPAYDGLGDIALATAADGNHLAMLRYHGANQTEVLLLNTDNGDIKHVALLDVKANDIAWRDRTQLVVGNDHTLYQLDISSGEYSAIFNSTDFINSFALTHNAVYLSTTVVNTSIWQQTPDKASKQIINSSRIDSLPRVSTDGEKIAFLSTRQGRYQVWLKQHQQEQLLAELPGTPAFSRMEWDAAGNNLLLVKDGSAYQLDVKDGTVSMLFNDVHPLQVANWGANDRSIIFSSQRSGSWQLWQLDLNSTKLQQLTFDGGYAGQIWQGKLYFTKFHQDGLWVKDLMQEAEQLLLPSVDKINWLNGQIERGKFYYYQPNQGIFSFDLVNGENTLAMAEPEFFVRHFSVFNQHIYYVLQHPLQGDIYRIPILLR